VDTEAGADNGLDAEVTLTAGAALLPVCDVATGAGVDDEAGAEVLAALLVSLGCDALEGVLATVW
jgi:hypothetical protein